MNLRQLFLQHLGQTTNTSLCFEIEKAQDCYLYDTQGKQYIDGIGGIGVANIGHGNLKVIDAIKNQSEKYLHTMVYGEMIQTPQVLYAKALCELLPQHLQTVFFTNSGAEATEGAMKLAKRYTGRHEIIAFNQSYHGSTQGALSLIGDEYWRQAYRPLLPSIKHFNYNSYDAVNAISTKTAAVVVEVIQAESGVFAAKKEWILALQQQCKAMGALLVVDEAQSAFGRCGSMFAFEQYQLEPDIVLLAKALGGGLPLGAFISSHQIMQCLADNPILGHISTFGGHPLSCASGLAALKELQDLKLIEQVNSKAKYLKTALEKAGIECFKFHGLWCAIFFKDFEINKAIVDECIANGLFTDWFLFASNALRICPPLCITTNQIDEMVAIIKQSIEKHI
jgi:acetylornithine/N-succinyldiaminopimelate aminotransferase